MTEEWRDIKGYEGSYQVSNLGRAVKIHCVEKDKTYESVSSAARDNHMANETIRLSIIENRKAKGLTFMRVDGGEF